MEAFRLVIAVDQALKYLEDRGIEISVYRHEMTNWINMVLHIPNSWSGQSNPESGFPRNAMAHLQTLTLLLDVDRPTLRQKPEETLRSVLAQIFDLLSTDDGLSETLRSYVFRLATEMRTALDEESIVGEFNFAEAAERLWVAMQAAAGQSRSHKRGWRAASSELFQDAGAAAIGSMPTLALTVMQLMQNAPA